MRVKFYFVLILTLSILWVNPLFSRSVFGSAVNETEPIILEDLRLKDGKLELTPDLIKKLETVLGMMKSDLSLEMIIAGHTDSTGSNASNLRLSLERAMRVKQWLVLKGIDSVRLRARGFGESKPMADNITAEGRAQNRRVEIKKVKDMEIAEPVQLKKNETVQTVPDKPATAFLPQNIFEFGPVVEGIELLHDFVIRNKGVGPLIVKDVQTG